MMTDDKNFPAFPIRLVVNGPNIDPIDGEEVPLGKSREHTFFGMSMRDYFAAKAMAAFIAGIDRTGGVIPVDDQRVAERAYNVADAMLEERSKE
jgi:hypothetical protein